MEHEEKLDLILTKLQGIEAAADKDKLHELAKQYWGFTEMDIKLIELAKRLLDERGKSEGNVLQLVSEMYVETIYKNEKLFTYEFK